MKSEHMYFMDDPLSKGISQEKTKNYQRKKIIGKWIRLDRVSAL